MRLPARFVVLAILFALASPHAAHASSLAWDQLSVPNARILSFSPDGYWLLASSPVQSDAGTVTSLRAAAQSGGDDDEPKLCVYAVPSLAPRSCSAPGVYLGDNGPNHISGGVSWSADGESLVFADGLLQLLQDGDIWKLHAGTGELENLTDDQFHGEVPFDIGESNPVYIDLQPAFSPTGESIAFSRTTFTTTERAVPSVVQIDLNTSEIATVATLPSDPYHLIDGRILWSNDGSRVFFTTSGIDLSANALWSAKSDGTSLIQITMPFTERGSDIALHDIDLGANFAIVATTRAMQLFKPPFYALVDLDSGAITLLSPSDPSVFAYNVAFDPNGNVLIAEEIPGEGDADDTVRLLSLDPVTGEDSVLGEGLPNLDFDPRQPGVTALPNDLIGYPSSRDGDEYSWTLVSLVGVDPVPATPVPSGGIAPGDTVVTTDATVLRTTPGAGSAIAAALDAGTELIVIDASVEVDGIVWWPVREPQSGALGYIPAALIAPES